MAFNFMLPLRAAQWLFALIVLGLTAYVVHYYNDYGYYSSSPSQDNFLLFVSLWTLLVVPYLALSPVYFPRFAHKFAIMAIDALTMLFWFAGFIALAVYISDFLLCVGRFCDSAKAAVVFGAFSWLLFLATTALAALHVWRTRGTNSTKPAAEMGVDPAV